MNKTVELLNNAFKKDPAVIRAFMCNHIPCNEEFANDEHIVVEMDRNIDGIFFNATVLGLINGVLSANNLPLIAAKWEYNEDKPNKFLGFQEYIPV